MKTHSWSKRLGFALAAIALIGAIVLGWYATRPGPLAFAAGKALALDAYGGHPQEGPVLEALAWPLRLHRRRNNPIDHQGRDRAHDQNYEQFH